MAPRASDQLDPDRSPLEKAAAAMRQIRRDCAWSREITHRDLVPYLVEESAELIDAVEVGTVADLQEELGDVLWQVLFHAAIAEERGADGFTIDDVAQGLTDKMVRRHPHVFGSETAATPEEVLVHWNAAKAAEKRERSSALDGISEHMPALAWAQKIAGRTPQGVALPAPDDEPQSESALGEALLALVAVAARRGFDAERALRERTRALAADIHAAEAHARD